MSTISNYKPIPLLAGFPKMCEKVMYGRVMHHFNSGSILVTE